MRRAISLLDAYVRPFAGAEQRQCFRIGAVSFPAGNVEAIHHVVEALLLVGTPRARASQAFEYFWRYAFDTFWIQAERRQTPFEQHTSADGIRLCGRFVDGWRRLLLSAASRIHFGLHEVSRHEAHISWRRALFQINHRVNSLR